VAVIRRDHQPDGEPGTNQLDVARQAIRSEAAARERAERSLAEAQVLIRDLQTKLAHERLAKDEALDSVRRLDERNTGRFTRPGTAEAELAAGRLAQRNAEDVVAEAVAGRQEAEERSRDAMVSRETRCHPSRRMGWRLRSEPSRRCRPR
jgi:chromosome segregation ATPase